jgi:hypothetical protein
VKTLVIIEVEHAKPIPALANLIAGRAYTIQGVTSAELLTSPTRRGVESHEEGFTLAELALGRQEVHRGC